MVEDGVLKTTPDGLRAQLDMAVVDVNGTIFHGRLARGNNRVAVTFKLVVVGDRGDERDVLEMSDVARMPFKRPSE